MIDDELFYEWLDGELDGEEAERVAAAVAASPELTAKAEQHRRLAAGLRDAFEPILADTGATPAFESGKVVEFGARVSERDRRRAWFAAPQWAAMAASLAIGLIIGGQFMSRSRSPVTVENGQLVAAAALDAALDTRLASTPAAGGARIGLTFRDATGRICRSFSEPASSGLACRAGDGWQVLGLFPASKGQESNYRMAAGEDPRLAALIDETIAGEPFDATQEKAALDAGWR